MSELQARPERRHADRPSSESALRELIHALAGTIPLSDLARRAAQAAIETTRARGAYVEQVIPSEGVVEVIAAIGDGTPPSGTRVPFPGSLTQELLERGTPEVLTDVRNVGERMAPYLAASCQHCVGLVAPLVIESDLLGSLVVLRTPEQSPFREDEVERVITIGEITSIALRRSRMVEREREAREQVTRTLESITDGFIALDPQWRVIYANREARRVIDSSLDTPPGELIGRSVWEVLPNISGTVFEAEYRQAMETQLPRHFEGYFEPWNRWFGVSLYPTREQLSIYFRDITEEKKSREELRRSAVTQSILAETWRLLEAGLNSQTILDRFTRLLVERLCDWCVIYLPTKDGARRAALASRDPAMEAKLRGALGEVLADASDAPAIQVLRTGTSKLLAEVPESVLTAAAAESRTYERILREHAPRSAITVPLIARGRTLAAMSIISTDPRRRYDELDLSLAEEIARRAALALDSAKLYEEATGRAITERLLRRAAAAVTAQVKVETVVSEIARNALVALEASGAFVERVDSDRGLVFVVAAAGESVPDVGASTPYQGSYAERVVEVGAPETIPDLGEPGRLVPKVLTTACAGCPALVVPLLREGTPGALFFLRSVGAPPFTEEEVTRAAIFGELAGLAFRKAHLLQTAEQRRAEAEIAVRARDDMLAVVSHDLRNPVHTIAMSASLLDDPDVPLREEERHKQRQIIKRAAARMNRLIQDLLDVSRIESGRFTIKCAWDDPARIAGEVCEAFAPIAEDRDVRLHCDLGASLPRICVDRDRILQVLGNFLDNALKFSPQDEEIVLAVQREPNGADDRGRDGVRFSVRDRGRGISAEALPHIFERYWQERTTAHKGAGLGLAIAKGIAEAHHGRVWAESTPGQGATFHLWLPLPEKCE